MIYDLIIIGAGPAAFAAALEAGDRRRKVLMLNKAAKPLLKLLASGGGSCNFTHNGEARDFLENYTEGRNFIRKSWYSFNNDALVSFMRLNNVEVICREDGKYFPESMEARQISSMLTQKFASCGGKLLNNINVKAVQFRDGLFSVKSDNESWQSSSLLIATGGNSYPTTGSDGSGYKLARSFGHKTIPPKPALSSITIENHFLQAVSGLSFEEVEAVFFRENRKIHSAAGPLIVTHSGFSGPVILDNSHLLEAGDEIRLNFAGSNRNEIEAKVREQREANPGKKFGNLPVFGIFSEKMRNTLGENTGKNFFLKKCAEINKQEIKLASAMLCEASFKIKKIDSWNKAMATSGGVNTKEVNPSTLESRIQPGLFFAGEVLNILGRTGGYNIQAAWSTGTAAGRNC